ncbi:MAG: hypothetical protein JKY92_03140 [Magnetovibrio sp.]|nr:hypothetical protein [Magnetovibrio sp.]
MSHENMLTDSSIITDIRPVFNDSRSGILGSIITFTMMLELSSQDSDKRVSIAMDLKDVEELKRSCEMAIEKGKEAQSVMQDKCGFDTFIMGEEDYGL